MHGYEIILFGLLFVTGSISADDNNITANVTTVDAITNATESSAEVTTPTLTTSTANRLASSTTIQSRPLLDDLIPAENSASKTQDNDGGDNDDDDDDVGQPNSENGPTAKRTINSKFNGQPIVVDEHVNLFTPNNEAFARRQRINVQIIEPEPHNNGQFLKETVFLRQENNTVITSKTTATTASSPTPTPTPIPLRLTTLRHKNIVIEQKFLAPIQAGLRLSHDARQRQLTTDDDCDDDKTQRTNIVVTERNNNRIAENVDIQQNTKIQRVIYKEQPKQTFVFGARVQSTTKSPCDQPCSTPRVFVPASTPRLQPTTRPRIVTSTVISPPRIVTTPITVVSPPPPPPPPLPAPLTPIPIKTVTNVVPVVTEKPIYIHTHSEVPVIQKQYVQLPPKIIEKPVIHKEVVQLPPQVQIVERPKVVVQKEYVQLPQKIVPVEVEKLVVKEVPIEKHIEHPPTVVEKFVPYPVPSKPVEVEKIVQVQVPVAVEKPVNHVVDRPVPVPYVQYVERPIHIPYILPVEVPVAYHVPYLVKPQPPPQTKSHIIIKTTKYGKGHGLFDWKHNHHKHIKHVIFKKPNYFVPDDIIAPPNIESIGLLPPPIYQPYFSDDFGPKASASINVAQAVLPNSVHSNRDQFFGSSPPIHNGFGSYDNKLKFVDSFSKDIRWEYGFKPPLVPSVAIDEFGNPLNEHR